MQKFIPTVANEQWPATDRCSFDGFDVPWPCQAGFVNANVIANHRVHPFAGIEQTFLGFVTDRKDAGIRLTEIENFPKRLFNSSEGGSHALRLR